MSKKRQERKEKARARQKEEVAKESAATAPTAPSETLEEANSKLAEQSRVINMKEAAERVKKTIPAGGVKKSHQGKPPAWAAGNPKLPPASKLPNLPRTRLPKIKPLRDCECGCGGKTKSRFVPGHDSYLRAVVMRVERDVMTLDEVEQTVSKGMREVVERIIKENKAAARKAKKEGKTADGESVMPPIAEADDADVTATKH